MPDQPTGTIFVYTISYQGFSLTKQRDLYRLSPTGGAAQLLCSNLAGPGMAAVSKDGTTLAVVAREQDKVFLHILSAPGWRMQSPVATVTYEIERGQEVTYEPELRISYDGSLILVTNPKQEVTYQYARASGWKVQEKKGLQSNSGMFVQEANALITGGGGAVGPTSMDAGVVMAAYYNFVPKSHGVLDSFRKMMPGAPRQHAIAILERAEGQYEPHIALQVPATGELSKIVVSENGDTAVARYTEEPETQHVMHIYAMRRDDPEQRWKAREVAHPGKTRGIVLSRDGKVLVVSEAPWHSGGSFRNGSIYPYDVYAVIWDGRDWSTRVKLSGPYEGDTYYGNNIATVSPDNSVVASFEHDREGNHYLCCTQLPSGNRLGMHPTGSLQHDFSPDSQWLAYMKLRGKTVYRASVDGSNTEQLFTAAAGDDISVVGWGK